jgi:hypothetical protein
MDSINEEKSKGWLRISQSNNVKISSTPPPVTVEGSKLQAPRTSKHSEHPIKAGVVTLPLLNASAGTDNSPRHDLAVGVTTEDKTAISSVEAAACMDRRLWTAAARGSLEAVELLLKDPTWRFNPSWQDPDGGGTALHAAAKHGHTDVYRYDVLCAHGFERGGVSRGRTAEEILNENTACARIFECTMQ